MTSMNLVKGMAIGIVVGSAIGACVTPSRRNRNIIGKALRTMGEVVENITDTLR